jgi:putative DNA primase/helicase
MTAVAWTDAVLAEQARADVMDPPEEAPPIEWGDDELPYVRHADGATPREPEPPANAIVLGADLHRVIDDAAEVLPRDGTIYQRDGRLVQVVRTAASEADALTLEGTPQIRGLSHATLAERLTRLASFAKRNSSGDWVYAIPPKLVIEALAARGQWRAVRPLVAVVEAPTLRPDGSVMQRAGYDGATGFVFMPSEDFPQVSDAPTLDDARAALEELKEPFADFPYASEAHAAVPIAAVLTILARPAIDGNVPAFLFDAPTRGTGKTLQTDVISIITSGRPSAKIGWPASDEELEKVVGAYALRGAPVINFDNVTRAFGGAPIDRCLTCGGSVELRVLGKSEVPALPWRAVVLASGNNIELSGDTARRVLVSRIESPLEHPEDRDDFKHPDLLGWVTAERPRLVRAALTILRAYAVAGRPAVGVKRWGSFEVWSDLIPSALVWAGAADPMLARPSVDAGIEPEKLALLSLLDAWARLDAEGQGMSAKNVIELLYTPERLRGGAPPDGFDAVREAIEALTKPAMPGKAPSPRALGYALRRFRGRVVGGRKFIGHADRSGVMRWSVVAAGYAGYAGYVSAPPAREKREDEKHEGETP